MQSNIETSKTHNPLSLFTKFNMNFLELFCCITNLEGVEQPYDGFIYTVILLILLVR